MGGGTLRIKRIPPAFNSLWTWKQVDFCRAGQIHVHLSRTKHVHRARPEFFLSSSNGIPSHDPFLERLFDTFDIAYELCSTMILGGRDAKLWIRP